MADKHNSSKVILRGKAVYQGDAKGMEVPCRLLFTTEDRCINVMRKWLYNLLYNKNIFSTDIPFLPTPHKFENFRFPTPL